MLGSPDVFGMFTQATGAVCKQLPFHLEMRGEQ